MYLIPRDPPVDQEFTLEPSAYAALFAAMYGLNSGNGMYWGDSIKVIYTNGVVHTFNLLK